MNIYPVKPHKRIILNFYRKPLYVNIPESNFVIKNRKIYYGIIKHDCLIATNLGFKLNCGEWKYNIKDDQELINKFWNTGFPTHHIPDNNIKMNMMRGFIRLKVDYDKIAIRNLFNELHPKSSHFVNIDVLQHYIVNMTLT